MVIPINVIGALITFLLLVVVCNYEVDGRKFSSEKMSKGLSKLYKSTKKVDKMVKSLENSSSDDPDNINDILTLIHQINLKIDDVNDFVSQIKTSANNAVFSLKNFISIEIELNEYVKSVNDIKARHDRMKLLFQSNITFATETKRAFAEWNITPGSESINSKLFNVFFTYFGYQNILIERIVRVPLVEKIMMEFHYEETHNLCPAISAQQYFFSDYLELKFLELKGYLIKKLSWAVLTSLDGTSFNVEEQISRQEQNKRSSLMIKKLQNMTELASREIRTCDPDIWIEGENYERLTRLIQGFIVNERNINSGGSCSSECKYLENTKIYDCYDNLCQNDKSDGTILRCESETNNDFITMCPSINPSRRYDYFETNRGYNSNNYLYGKKESCGRNEVFVKSWGRYVYKCSYCFCLLDEMSHKSDRFINLREVLSNVEQNKVVTGVRFIKKNRVIYLQIQQGELGPFGSITKYSLEWKDIGSHGLEYGYMGEEYIALSYRLKTINLGDIVVEDPNYVVTGLKFSKMGSGLSLSVRVTYFDFEQGILEYLTKDHIWLTNTWKHKMKVPLSGREPNRGPNLSTMAPGKSIPSERFYDLVEFTHSDKKSDASQTTLPFFDSQDVASRLPCPLSGIGLYHKGFKGYGGFIAPKIFTVDFFNFM